MKDKVILIGLIIAASASHSAHSGESLGSWGDTGSTAEEGTEDIDKFKVDIDVGPLSQPVEKLIPGEFFDRRVKVYNTTVSVYRVNFNKRDEYIFDAVHLPSEDSLWVGTRYDKYAVLGGRILGIRGTTTDHIQFKWSNDFHSEGDQLVLEEKLEKMRTGLKIRNPEEADEELVLARIFGLQRVLYGNITGSAKRVEISTVEVKDNRVVLTCVMTNGTEIELGLDESLRPRWAKEEGKPVTVVDKAHPFPSGGRKKGEWSNVSRIEVKTAQGRKEGGYA